MAYIVRPKPWTLSSHGETLPPSTTRTPPTRTTQSGDRYMQTLQAPRHSPQHVSSRHYIAEPWSVELSVRDAREQTGSRHDERMLAARTVPADPYKVWLEQHETDCGSSAVPV